MNLLIQFLLRLSFGLAAGMAITSPKRVTSGYFRNHLYVTLGLTTLAATASYSIAYIVFWCSVSAAVISYAGAISWLYERHGEGKLALLSVMLFSFFGAFFLDVVLHEDSDVDELPKYSATSLSAIGRLEPADLYASMMQRSRMEDRSRRLHLVSVCSSGLLLGLTMAAMLLGHWYLNTPTMELVPLRRLIIAMGGTVVLQAIVSGLGLWGELTYANEISTQWTMFLILRWTFGIIGVGVLAWMAWQTLKIPNTQSATGILYVAVIGTFVGETMGLLLSGESLFPL